MLGRLIGGILRFAFGFAYAVISGLWKGSKKPR